MRHPALLILLFFIGCKQHPRPVDDVVKADTAFATQPSNILKTRQTPSEEESDTATTFKYQTTPFPLIKEYPIIRDTLAFIAALRENCHLYFRKKELKTSEEIHYFKKTKIYGSQQQFYIIEYYHGFGGTAACPWQYQFIFNLSGKLVSILSALRIDIVKIFPSQPPFLITVSTTGKGNGWHNVYRIKNNKLEDIYDHFLGYRPQTYDAHEDNDINTPNEFPYKTKDVNKDGYNDLVFAGKITYSTIDLGINNKTVSARFVFLYNQQTGHFTEQEDYSKKYEFIYGNTK
jgi:hypothetical protein